MNPIYIVWYVLSKTSSQTSSDVAASDLWWKLEDIFDVDNMFTDIDLNCLHVLSEDLKESTK